MKSGSIQHIAISILKYKNFKINPLIRSNLITIIISYGVNIFFTFNFFYIQAFLSKLTMLLLLLLLLGFYIKASPKKTGLTKIYKEKKERKKRNLCTGLKTKKYDCLSVIRYLRTLDLLYIYKKLLFVELNCGFFTYSLIFIWSN